MGYLILLASTLLDSSRGLFLPLIRSDLSLTTEEASWFFVAGNLGATVLTALLLPLMNRWGEYKTSFAVVLSGILACISLSLIYGKGTLIAQGLLIGGVIAMLAAVSNVFVIRGAGRSNPSRWLCGLHVMYGLGSIISPFAVTMMLSLQWSWRLFFLWIIPLFLILVVLFARTKEFKNQPTESQSTRLDLKHIVVICAFFLYVGAEVMTTLWMPTYLVDVVGFRLEDTDRYVSSLFLVMLITRLIGMTEAFRKIERASVWCIPCLFILFFYLGRQGHLWALPLCGIAGPFFPVVIGRVSQHFPENWRSLAVWMLTANQLALMACHFMMGKLATSYGVSVAYWSPIPLMCLCLIFVVIYLRTIDRPHGIRKASA